MATVNLWEYDGIWVVPGVAWHVWYSWPETLQTVQPVFRAYPWGRGSGSGTGGQAFKIVDEWYEKLREGNINYHVIVENTGELSGEFIPMLSWILNPI